MTEQIKVSANLIVAEPGPEGAGYTYTWTLPSRLGQCLDLAEEMFGPRDKSYTILGIDFTTEENPKHWFPGGKDGRKDVIILLTLPCATDDDGRALYQLAHETFHVLSPAGKLGRATVFEEGLAVFFADAYLDYIGKPPRYDRNPKYQKYDQALDDVMALIQFHPDMLARIRDFRTNANAPSEEYGSRSCVSAMTLEEFKRIFPDAPNDLAERLTANFYASTVAGAGK